jgi:hypothetical protein
VETAVRVEDRSHKFFTGALVLLTLGFSCLGRRPSLHPTLFPNSQHSGFPHFGFANTWSINPSSAANSSDPTFNTVISNGLYIIPLWVTWVTSLLIVTHNRLYIILVRVTWVTFLSIVIGNGVYIVTSLMIVIDNKKTGLLLSITSDHKKPIYADYCQL